MVVPEWSVGRIKPFDWRSVIWEQIDMRENHTCGQFTGIKTSKNIFSPRHIPLWSSMFLTLQSQAARFLLGKDLELESRLSTAGWHCHQGSGKIWNINPSHSELYWKPWNITLRWCHMNILASEITSNLIVCSTACPSLQQRPHQSSASLALCEGNPLVTGGFPSQRASNVKKKFQVMTS